MVEVAGDAGDFGVANHSDDRGATEDVGPKIECEVACKYQQAPFVAGGDELEEQARGVVVERDTSNFSNNQELVAPECEQFRLEAPVVGALLRRATESLMEPNKTRCLGWTN